MMRGAAWAGAWWDCRSTGYSRRPTGAGERQESDCGSRGRPESTLTPASKIAAAARTAEKIHKFMSEANEALKKIVGNAVSW